MEREGLATEILDTAADAGASAAEVMFREGSEFSTTVRLGSVEKLVQASFRKVGVRLFDGRRSAVAATSDFGDDSLRRLVSDTLTLARASSEDPQAGLPEAGLYQQAAPNLELSYPEVGELGPEKKIAIARKCEDSSFDFDPRINNSEGAAFSDSMIHTTYANSHGVCRSYSKTLASLHATPLAEMEGQKQRDFWLTTHVDFSQLDSPEEVGREAARRTIRRLGARKIRTCEVPVVFDPLAGARLLKHLAEAVSGTLLVRKASFLLDKLGTRVASPEVTICDHALLPGGLGSRPFDSEGIPSQNTVVIEHGILVNFLLDSYSARRLGMQTTGNSARELSGPPTVGPSNFYLMPGDLPPAQIIESVQQGLYVTEVIGFGANIVSGDYSQGAAGLWIENGELAYPVEEITIAGNLREMLQNIEAVASDLRPLGETFTPTFKISRMVISGN